MPESREDRNGFPEFFRILQAILMRLPVPVQDLLVGMDYRHNGNLTG